MKAFNSLKTICRIILPFVIMLALFIIFNGDLSPGGGFQGGVVLASVFLVVYFISEDKPIPFSKIIRMEKKLFIALILSSVTYILVYQGMADVLPERAMVLFRVLSLVYLNLLIGMKVAIGLCGIMVIFIEEGNP